MKYKEMVKFLDDNNIQAIQPAIASEVSYQLETDTSDEDFEEICDNVFYAYISSDGPTDIRFLVEIEIKKYGYESCMSTEDNETEDTEIE